MSDLQEYEALFVWFDGENNVAASCFPHAPTARER